MNFGAFISLIPFLLFFGTAQADSLSLGLNIPSRSGRSSTDVNVRWSQTGKNESDKRATGLCATTATLIYTSAFHPTGNRRGILNENSDGYGARCYLGRDESFYLVVAMLRNSQYGDTFAFGPGAKWRLFELSPAFGNTSIDVGVEAPWVNYQYGPVLGKYMRGQGRAINSPLPMLYVGFDPLPLDNQVLFSREPRIAREPRVGPTFFLQYRF